MSFFEDEDKFDLASQSKMVLTEILFVNTFQITNCCNTQTKFHRYNDISQLLLTRKGRCGEYANCFTFLCRSLGYEARLVDATFDHVWTEVS